MTQEANVRLGEGDRHQPLDGNVLREVLARFGCRETSVQQLDSFVSKVYACRRERDRIVLKITPGWFRTADQILAELDFVAYLGGQGIPTARTIPSLRGRWVETVSFAHRDFLAYGFQWIDGERIDGPALTPAFLRRSGELMGRIHIASKSYPEAHRPRRRPDWDEKDRFERRLRRFPPSLSRVGRDAGELLRRLRRLPIDRDCCGLLHGDMNAGNLLCGDSMWVIDFENCYYGWFADDIAAALYYTAHDRWYHFSPETYRQWAAGRGLGPDGASFAAYYLEHFLAGYASVRPFAREWVERIPDFLHLRHLDEFFAQLDGWPPRFDVWGGPASLESHQRELEAGIFV